MLPLVRVRLADGQSTELHSGDFIGRSDRAALCLLEPHISEAHAMVSLRSGELKLLALRGRFSVDGKPVAQVTLRPGLRVVLASRTPLIIDEVRLPEEVLALEDPHGHRQVIDSVSSLRLGASPSLVSGFAPDADAVLWTSGERLYARVGDAAPRALEVGDALDIGGQIHRVVAAPWEAVSRAPTQESTEVGAPLHLILNFDTVHIIAGPSRVILDGIAARIVCELAAIGAPVAWQEVAREIWGRDTAGEVQIRQRWDSSLARIRRRLKEARLRTDLVHCTRGGQVELALAPGDTIEDRM